MQRKILLSILTLAAVGAIAALAPKAHAAENDMVATCATPGTNCAVRFVKATADTLTFNNAGAQCWVNTAPSPCAFRKVSAMAKSDLVLASTAGSDGRSIGSAEKWVPVSALALYATSTPTTPPPVVTKPDGKVTIRWTLPTANTDGSVLQDLTGINVYQGTSEADLKAIVTLQPTATTYTADLAAGSYVFALSASNSVGVESVKTPLLPVKVVKTVTTPNPPGNASISVTVTVPAP